MRRYVDCIRVSNANLAFTIVEALEKNEEYSVDFYDQDNGLVRKGDCRPEIELRVYENQKVMPAPTTGFTDGGTEDDKA